MKSITLETDAPPANRKFHLSLNVADLGRSVAFYRVLFGTEPAKCRPDYAKFELPDPPVVLSLEPLRHAPGGSLNHLGLRVPDAAALVDVQRRLEAAGLATQREDGVECCYARQTKFWVADPDRNSWELYVVEGDIDHKGGSPRPGGPAGATPAAMGGDKAAPAAAAPIVWEHQLGQPVPDRIPLADGSADDVLLRGTFNAALPPADVARLVGEAARVLRRGGRVSVHALIADRPLSTTPKLPGPAAAVERVPTADEPLAALASTGFEAVYLEKFGESGCFRHEGVGLRELLAVGTKAGASPFDLLQTVVYRGPFAQATDDAGNVYRRGEPAAVGSAAAELLRAGPAADQFTFLPPGGH